MLFSKLEFGLDYDFTRHFAHLGKDLAWFLGTFIGDITQMFPKGDLGRPLAIQDRPNLVGIYNTTARKPRQQPQCIIVVVQKKKLCQIDPRPERGWPGGSRAALKFMENRILHDELPQLFCCSRLYDFS